MRPKPRLDQACWLASAAFAFGFGFALDVAQIFGCIHVAQNAGIVDIQPHHML